ncbi:MAG: amino acid adenylation domain-containing protein, partial [Bacteroidota bacterium]
MYPYHIDDLISKLKRLDIQLRLSDDNLKIMAPEGVLKGALLQEIKEHKTELKNYIREATAKRAFSHIPKAEPKDFYQLSSAQKRMYVLHEMDKDSLAYNMPLVYRFDGSVDYSKLNAIFQKLIERHEMLRTSFHLVDGVPVQKIAAQVDFEMVVKKCSEQEVPALMQLLTQPFDLSNGPLLRIHLLHFSEDAFALFVDMHHIISDGVSHRVLMNDFMAFYRGETPAPLKIQYKDYSEWQQSAAHQEMLNRQKTFWLKTFEAETSAIELPCDFPRPLVNTHAGRTLDFEIDRTHTQLLKALAQKEEVTMYMLLLSIFNVLLSKLSSQEDIVVGTPVSGRQHADLEEIIGVFVNTLALRSFPKSTLSFQDFLRQVKTNVLQSFENQSFQYEALVEALGVLRDGGRNPLFDVMFDYDNFSDRSETDAAGEDLIVNQQDSAKFDLSLSALEVQGRLKMTFEYSTDLFKKSSIERFVGYFQQVVRAVVDDVHIPLAKINILPVAEERQLLLEFNNPKTEYPNEGSIVERFERQVMHTPQRTAIIDKTSQLSYEVFNERVNQLAHFLMKHKGMQAGGRIGVYTDRSVDMVICLMAILKSGAAFIAIDSEYGSERVRNMIEDANADLVMTNLVEDWEKINAGIAAVDLVGEGEAIAQCSKENPAILCPLDSLALIIYTSGSTGKPKGIMLEHSAMLDYFLTFNEYFSLGQDDSFIQQASLSFDTSIEEIFPVLMVGASVQIMPDRGRDIDYILEAIKNRGATILSTTPSVLNELNKQPSELANLRVILSGGDLLLPAHVDQLIGPFDVYNTYGPSESTVCITYNKIEKIEDTSYLGQPIANREVLILNPSGQLCPVLVTGELCVAGAGLARGYVGRPALNREKFIEHPFRAGDRIYKTGDLARWLPDGNIEFLGRIDNQLKIHGFRIELGEIEHQLSAHPSVEEAAVVAIKEKGEKRLAAYYVSQTPLKVEDLRNYLMESLPHYMIPTYFISLDKLPMTTNGKLNKKALPAPEVADAQAFELPSNETEASMLKIWSEVLELPEEQISINSNFFALGGHSLKATLLINKVSKEMMVDVPLKEIFRSQDIRSLSAFVQDAQKVHHTAIPKAAKKDYYPLSSAQKRMFFLQSFDPNSLAYNMPQVDRLKVGVDFGRLQQALAALINRHEILRTSFQSVADQTVQVIADEMPFEIEKFTTKEQNIDALVQQFIRPFNLSQAPLLRVGLAAIEGSSDQLLLVDMHHIISDGVSHEILIHDFLSLYAGRDLPALNLQYKDYAEWQQSAEHQSRIEQEKTFWLNEFADEWNVPNLPTDRPRPATKSLDGAVVESRIGKETSRRLKVLAEEKGVTMYMLLLALYYTLLSRLTGEEDLVVGTPVSGRQHADLENTIGMFVNTLALRNQPQGEKPFDVFLQELKDKVLQCFEYQSFQ